MAENDEKKRIVLRGNQQTTIAIGVTHEGKSQFDPGDKIKVESSAATIISARFNPETALVDVVPIEGAVGPSDVIVTITLADGTVLPPQVVEYEVVHPYAEDVSLTPGTIVDKETIVTNPVPNPEPHVIPDAPPPEQRQHDAVVDPTAASTEEPHDPDAHPHGYRAQRGHRKS